MATETRPSQANSEDSRKPTVEELTDQLKARDLADEKRRKRNKGIAAGLGATVAAGLLAGGSYLVGSRSGDSAPETPGTSPGNAAPIESGTPAEGAEEVDTDPYGVADLDLPKEALDWIEVNQYNFPPDLLADTWQAKQYYEEALMLSRELPSDWADNFKVSSDVKGQIPGIAMNTVGIDVELSPENPDAMLDWFNSQGWGLLNTYLNTTAANPQMKAEIEAEFKHLTGSRAEAADNDQLVDWLDSVVAKHGPNSIYSVRMASYDNAIDMQPEDSQDEFTILRTRSNSEGSYENFALYANPTKADENGTIQGVDFVTDLAINVMSFNEKGEVYYHSTEHSTVVLSLDRDSTDNYNSSTVWVGVGDSIGNIPPYEPKSDVNIAP